MSSRINCEFMRLRCSIVIALVLLSACSDRRLPVPVETVETVKGTGIVDQVSISMTDGLPHIDVCSIPGTPLRAVAHIEVFEDFAPGLTFTQASQRFGDSVASRTLTNRTELRYYSRGDRATLAVGRELYFSSSPPVVWWTVWAFPKEGTFSFESLVNSNVLSQIPPPQPPFYLVLRDATASDESLWLRAESNGITEVRWINSESWRNESK